MRSVGRTFFLVAFFWLWGLALAASAQSSRPALGDYYRDPANNFAIRPPYDWVPETKSPRYLVRFRSSDYQAYIVVDAIKLSAPVTFDQEFFSFIAEKNREVAKAIPSYQTSGGFLVKLNPMASAYKVSATFKAGPNLVLMNTYYLPFRTKLFMVTTIYPQATAKRWGAVVNMSVASFAFIE